MSVVSKEFEALISTFIAFKAPHDILCVTAVLDIKGVTTRDPAARIRTCDHTIRVGEVLVGQGGGKDRRNSINGVEEKKN